jgi:hypothetical protein
MFQNGFWQGTAYAAEIPLPGSINVGNILFDALKIGKTLTSEQIETLRESFKWLIHYTDLAGFVGISGSNTVNAGANGAFFSKEIPITTSPQEEIAEKLQLSYPGINQINPAKAGYFFIIDASDLTPNMERDVQRNSSLLDAEGNPQFPGPTGAKEYIFNESVNISGKVIFSGPNVVGMGIVMMEKIIEYFLKKTATP